MKTPEEILAKHGYPIPGDDLDPNLIHAMEEFVQECETNYSYFWEDAHAKLQELQKRYDSAILEGDLLRTKNEELQEGLIEYQNDYQDICELAGEIALPFKREALMLAVGPENYERFKNHIGW